MPTLKVKHAVAPSVAPTREEIIAAHPLPHFLAGRDINISMVSDAFSTSTHSVNALSIINAIKQGRWREEVARIRRLYNDTLTKTGSHEKARDAVEDLK